MDLEGQTPSNNLQVRRSFCNDYDTNEEQAVADISSAHLETMVRPRGTLRRTRRVRRLLVHVLALETRSIRAAKRSAQQGGVQKDCRQRPRTRCAGLLGRKTCRLVRRRAARGP